MQRRPNPFLVVRHGRPYYAPEHRASPDYRVETIRGTRTTNPYFVLRNNAQQITNRQVIAPVQTYSAPYTIRDTLRGTGDSKPVNIQLPLLLGAGVLLYLWMDRSLKNSEYEPG
jgi:hypothetical protein